MDREIRIKELESAVNELWRVQGKYSVKVIVDETGKVVFSVFENETKELLMDLAVLYGDDIKPVAKALEQELRHTYIVDLTNRMRHRPVKAVNNVLDFEQWIREAKFYCEWIEIFRTVRKSFEEKLSA